MANKTIPTKIYLTEEELPKYWYNMKADMIEQHDPILNPQTLEPVKKEELERVFCSELVEQELNETDRYIEIPQENFNCPKSSNIVQDKLYNKYSATYLA